MRRTTPLFFYSALLIGGCVEYDIASPADIHGLNNPRELVIPVNNDAIVQVTIPQADILFIVDDSSSMEPEQTQLAESFPKFLDYFLGSGLDYHIGVISTDYPTDRGKLESGLGELWITDETENPQGVFQDMAEMGGWGDSYESGIGTSYAALELQKEQYNTGYYREDASLHVIVMSDENDWTQQHGVITNEEYISWITTLKPSPDMVSFNSIVNQVGCCGGNNSPLIVHVILFLCCGGNLCFLIKQSFQTSPIPIQLEIAWVGSLLITVAILTRNRNMCQVIVQLALHMRGTWPVMD